MSATSTIDPARLASLIEAEEATFNERHKLRAWFTVTQNAIVRRSRASS